MKVFVLQALGFGDREDEFVNIGVFSTMEKVEAYKQEVQADWDDDDDYEVVFNVENYEVQ